MMTLQFTRLVVCSIALAAVPAAVRAGQAPQDQPASEEVRRPFRGLFGAPPDLSRRHSLIASASLFAAYDDDVFADHGVSGDTLNPADRRRDGIYSGATAGLAYSRRGDRVTAGLSADVGVHKYKDRDPLPGYRVGANISGSLARHTSVSLAGSAGYSPEFRLGVFTSPVSPTGFQDPFTTVLADYDVYSLAALRTSAGGGITQTIGRRASVNASYWLTNIDYTNDSFDYRSHSGGLRYTQRLTRNVGAHLGYGYATAEYSLRVELRPLNVHRIDAGIDYGRALSISRRTRVSFSTGSAIISGQGETTGRETSDFTLYLSGAADLTHEMGRTWKALLSYRRGIDAHEGFSQLFLSNGLSGGVSGLLSRRVSFGSGVDYVVGRVGLTGGAHYSSVSASAGLQYALSRSLALFGRYVYYKYDFDRQVAVDPRLPRALDRQGVRVGLSASIPVIR
jgi:opacity protein-like surface antigen